MFGHGIIAALVVLGVAVTVCQSGTVKPGQAGRGITTMKPIQAGRMVSGKPGQAGRGVSEKPAGRSALGGLEKEKPVDAVFKTFFADKKVIAKIEEHIHKKMNHPSKTPLKLEPLTFASQMVAGTNFFVKTKVTCPETKAISFWTIKIHQAPGKPLEVMGVSGPHMEADPIAHFDESTAGPETTPGKPGQAGRGVAMKAAHTGTSAQGQLSKEMPADAVVKAFFADKKIIAKIEELLLESSVKKPIKLEPLTFVHLAEGGGTSYLVKARVTCGETKEVSFRTILIHHPAGKTAEAMMLSPPHDESAKLEM